MNKNLLLSPDEYESLPDMIRYQVPYIYSLEHKAQNLCYFGSKHIFDSTHAQFGLLHEHWVTFLNKIRTKKTIVIYEGSVNERNLISWEESIKNNGEFGAIVFLAKQSDIPYFRPEPTIEQEVMELLKDFSKEDIFYFYMIRGIETWQRKINPENFEEFIARNSKRYKDVLQWKDFDFSFNPMILQIHKRIFDKELVLEDKNFIRRIQSPSFSESIINDISRKSLRIRDGFILESIANYWIEGYNLFIVYGSAHAKIQERAIRDMVEKT